MCTKCSKQVLWAFDKSLAGKKMPAGTRLGTAVLSDTFPSNYVTTMAPNSFYMQHYKFLQNAFSILKPKFKVVYVL
jgi:hypothetical protein